MKRTVTLSKYEEELAYGALHPSEIITKFEDIGGHEAVILRLCQITNLLLTPPKRTSRLFSAPTGILLYGPPGCGKTMIAKALAKESGVRFIALNLATVMDKWVGETEKYIEALFSLARKIAPVIIFVDEIDALTRRRGSIDREWSSGMKSQLLSQWDGLQSDASGGIVVLGATNRPQDIDEAFMRRMPLQMKIDLPTLEQRKRILEIFTSDLEIVSIDFAKVAEETARFSGSDLHELCRRTVLNASLSEANLISTDCFLHELDAFKLESAHCRQYN